MANRAFFVTGTDTGIGKTTITGACLCALQQRGQSVGILKPMETGIDFNDLSQSDTERLRLLLSPSPAFDSVCRYAFAQPLSPLAAARETHTAIDLSLIHSHIDQLTHQYAFLLMEGAGGIFTPLTPKDTMRDFLAMLNIPCVVVGRTSLGAINHCLLTLEALQHRHIPVHGIVLNEPTLEHQSAISRRQQESTVELIRELAPVPVFGPIEFHPAILIDWQEGMNQISREPEIQRLVTYLIEMV